ncbi:MAG TPA: VWA domain-containing protein [Terriglobia bacterium]|nr:VWA domain-containing protein [Terriglobia bacterium]
MSRSALARRPRRFRWSAIVIVAVALVCELGWMNAGSGGQSTTPAATPQRSQPFPRTGFQHDGFTLRAQRNEVLVDVRVYDKKGRPVTNLRQQDFHVTEDGAQQKINSFEVENVDKLLQAEGKSGVPPVIDLSHVPAGTTVKSIIQNHRMIVLFLDLTSMQVDDLMRALNAAENFVKKQMTPADLVALVTYTSDLRVVQNFTNNRNLLEKALKDIEMGNSNDLATAGSVGAAGGTDASGNTIVTQDTSEAFTPDETEFNIFNTDEKLAAIQSLSEMLSGIPGRKNVIQFSSGIEQTGIENQAQLRATIDAANRANVSLYTVDARGLVALPPGGDATSSSPSGIGIYTNQAVSSEVNDLHNGRETLATLSTETGGRTFYDMNDFSQAFKDVQTLNTSYYLLGYTPTNSRSDGRFRHIRVTVDVAGVKVQARPGYYAPKNFRQFTKEDKEAQLEQAMDLESPFVELPLAVEASYFLRPDKKYDVVLAAKIPGSAISFLQKSNLHRTEFDFAWRATDSSGHIAAALRDTLPVKLESTTYQQVVSGNILYEGGFVLPPGKYKLKAVVRENESGKLGTFEEPLDLPAVGGPNLEISSVIVSNQLQNASAAGAKKARGGKKSANQPLVIGNQAVLPSVTRVFRTDQNLYVYLESYLAQTQAQKQTRNANGGPSNQIAPGIPPQFALVFFRGNIQVSEAGPYPGKLKQSVDQTSTYFTKIPLEKFPPGRYWMQVNVLDPSAGKVAFARVPLAIMPPPKAAASASR